MTSPQTAAYKPTPISQRDGSTYANSNCRMAAIATGLDYDTKGAKKSTGQKMRDYSGDASGGTNSGNAKTAWDRGYGENLSVRDGNTFDTALADLRAGHSVHLDVWHASVSGSGICLSGSGAYGHTIFVLCDYTSSGWSVADPWCSPPKLARVSESELRQGAEKWGADVYGSTSGEPDYPTGDDRDPTSEKMRELAARVVSRLMSERFPGGNDSDEPEHVEPETGGAQPILYTRTTNHAPLPPSTTPSHEESDVMQTFHVPLEPTVATVKTGAWLYQNSGLDSNSANIQVDPGRDMPCVGKTGDAYIVAYVESDGTRTDGAYWVRLADVSGTKPDPAAGGIAGASEEDVAAAVDAAIAERDDEWQDWLLSGAPGSVSD